MEVRRLALRIFCCKNWLNPYMSICLIWSFKMFGLLFVWLWSLAFNPSHAVDPIAFRWEVTVSSSYVNTEDDDSFQRFLDKEHPFFDIDYEPSDLKAIESDFTANNARNYLLREEAWKAFADMAWNFWNDFSWKQRLSINTAYRSYGVQKYLMTSYCAGRSWQCALPWTSEHQAWLALDLWVNGRSLDNASFQWLQNNAHKWWFHNTYQKWIEIDGQISEPWHRRYLWVELATQLHEKNQSFAEWYYSLER